ncbi:MAG: thermonuclease family protein [Microcystis sp. M54BS1]|uniref:thermonuclease family protein n=1 Tax=unclassified Microcystis TaxID=2643300 RepID=UPI00257ADCCC|nr:MULTISPECIES: thermonuclease family protein [unclassified Microcystis]MCA2537973.1 thermonuclease family protein [Microcystis sp. M54BS1]MCA2598017.1 thermonuclease family protein [Microcystis sp. M38BS1]MCA2612936.1 thermonuclease family protein [Microcystis sp. M27BS1]MCA2506848.1 thermonuclease family protein [Microcystis sp. M62BS1]MCA2509444.1 thermonuclease family protein [Microcystis sp. M60BS1]
MGKKYPLLIIALIAIILLGIKSRSTGDAGEKVKIIRCHDGDTCTTDKGEKIRLACIDAPELKQPFGKASRNHLREIIKDRPVKIDRINTDRFGRTIAILYISNRGKWQAVQSLQAHAGTVWAFDRFKRNCPIWNSIDREFQAAQSKKIGLFTDRQAVEPWIWRQNEKLR